METETKMYLESFIFPCMFILKKIPYKQRLQSLFICQWPLQEKKELQQSEHDGGGRHECSLNEEVPGREME